MQIYIYIYRKINPKKLLIILYAFIFLICISCKAHALSFPRPEKLSLINRFDGKIIRKAPEEKKIISFEKYTIIERPFKYYSGLWYEVLEPDEKDLSVKIITDSQGMPVQEKPPELKGIELALPGKAELNISGKKTIDMKLSKVKYFKGEDQRTFTPETEAFNIDVDQALQVRIKGKVGRKINVNVDYDDTKEDKRDISVVYKGDPNEVVQEAAFGDIELTLPKTEFIAYNKKLFGIKTDLKYKHFRLLGIASKTKGISESKEFSGKTTLEKKDIYDTGYLKRRYYKVDLNVAHIIEDWNTLRVYVDDRNKSTNNTEAYPDTIENAKAWLDTSDDTSLSAIIDIDLLSPGEDYIIDTERGILSLNSSLGDNHVLAVAYKYNGGSVGYNPDNTIDYQKLKMLKDEDNTVEFYDYEQKNYYYLEYTSIVEDDMYAEIIDLNRNSVQLLWQNGNDVSESQYKIDYIDSDLGILKFSDAEPFSSGVYQKTQTTPANHELTIYVEYKRKVKIYNVGKIGIVPNSERVRLNGNILTRDIDYMFDYDIGLLTFFREDDIDDDAVITVDYEYMPFGGLFQQTILGLRGEYNPHENFSLGSTYMTNFSQKPSYVPQANSTPESLSIIDVDSRYKHEFEAIPLQTELYGEIAKSRFDPNISGQARIDNMEGAKIEDIMPTLDERWQYSSIPSNITATERGTLNLSNEDISVKTINPNTLKPKEEEQQVLVLNYNLPESSYVSLVYPISKDGEDYSNRKFLKAWIYGVNASTPTLHIDIGRINEDIDNDGLLDSEDININGILDTGEDTGIDVSQYNTVLPSDYGKDDSILTTEDLDGDCFLDIVESLPGNTMQIDVYKGWNFVSIPLDITSTNKDSWTAIKHIRLWLEDSNKSGTIKIASLSIVGNRWEDPIVTGTADEFIIDVISNEDSATYDSPPGIDLEDDEREQSLQFKYTNLTAGSEGYTKFFFSKAQDYSKHKSLKFFLHGDSSNATFFINLGSSDSEYFSYERIINWGGWKLIEINLKDSNNDGFPDDANLQIPSGTSPRLDNITQIKIGLRNDTGATISDGEIWVDEIELDKSIIEEGWAKRIGINNHYGDWGSLNMKYKIVDRDFRTIGVTPQNKDIEEISADSKISKLDYLPIGVNYIKTKTVSPSDKNNNLPLGLQDSIITQTRGTTASVIVKKWPRLDTLFSQTTVDASLLSNSQLFKKNSVTDIYKTGVTYDIPVKFFLLPRNMNAGYKRTNSFTYYAPEIRQITSGSSYDDILNMTHEYSAKTAFYPSDNISFIPSYDLKSIKERRTSLSGAKSRRPKSNVQTLKASSTLKLLKWFAPNISYNMSSTENFVINTSSKDVNRTGTLSGNLPISVKSVFPMFKPTNSLTVNTNYKVEKGDSYDKISQDRNVLSRLWIKGISTNDGRLKSSSSKITFGTSSRWKPLDYINFKDSMKPLKTLDTTFGYTKIDEDKGPTASAYSAHTKIFPDVGLTLSEIESFPLLSSFMQSSVFDIKYIHKKIDKVRTSVTRTDTWKSSWRLKVFKKYSLLLNSSDTKTNNKNPQGVETTVNRDINNNIQVIYKTPRGMTLTFRYDDNRGKRINKGLITSKSFTGVPVLKVEKDFDFSKGLKLPFIKKPLKLTNEVTLASTLMNKIERSSTAKNEKDTYSIDLSVDYDVSENLNFAFGSGTSLVMYKNYKENNYYIVDIRLKGILRF